jgi:hypothetical protein
VGSCIRCSGPLTRFRRLKTSRERCERDVSTGHQYRAQLPGSLRGSPAELHGKQTFPLLSAASITPSSQQQSKQKGCEAPASSQRQNASINPPPAKTNIDRQHTESVIQQFQDIIADFLFFSSFFSVPPVSAAFRTVPIEPFRYLLSTAVSLQQFTLSEEKHTDAYIYIRQQLDELQNIIEQRPAVAGPTRPKTYAEAVATKQNAHLSPDSQIKYVKKSKEITVKIPEKADVKKLQETPNWLFVARIRDGELQSSKNMVTVRKLPNKSLLIQTASASAKEDLEKNTAWTKHIADSAQIVRKRFFVVAHGVPFASIDIDNQKDTIDNIL